MIFLIRSIRVCLDFFVIVGWFQLIKYILIKIFTIYYNNNETNQAVAFPVYYVILGPVVSLVSVALFFIVHICFQWEMKRRQMEFYRQRISLLVVARSQHQKTSVGAA